MNRNLKQAGIALLAVVGAGFLFLWSIPSSVDFLLKMRHRSGRKLVRG